MDILLDHPVKIDYKRIKPVFEQMVKQAKEESRQKQEQEQENPFMTSGEMRLLSRSVTLEGMERKFCILDPYIQGSDIETFLEVFLGPYVKAI